MTVFDLLFLACVLATLVTLITAAAAAVRGRRSHAISILKRLGVAAGAYLFLVVLVAAVSPQRVMQVGDPWCFDDWCLSVESVDRAPEASGIAYRVSLRIASRARRVTQRTNGAWIYLIDPSGRRFEPVPDPAAIPLDVQLQPGESVLTTRLFHVPQGGGPFGLITGHGGAYCSMPLIIGQGGCLFRKPAIVRLE